MADPVIVPPPPVVTQPSRPGEPVDTSPGMEQVQKAFDRVFPAIKTEPTPKTSTPQEREAPPAPVEHTQEPQKPAAQEPATTTEKPPDESHKLPSFLEKALEVPTEKPTVQPATDEWPEEIPVFKTPEESKDRYRKWREQYNKLKEEVQTLRSRPQGADEATVERLKTMESQNKEMQAILARVGVEQHQEFQNNVMRPLVGAWNEAARIVKESGADPNDLAKAMTLSGKAQFEALDSIMEGMPESAKIEVNEALRNYRRYDEVRRKAIAEAPKTMEALRKKDLETQYQVINQQREEMRSLFDDAVRRLRDEGKVEVLQKSNDPESKWWNDQADAIIKSGQDLYLENTDMGKMAMAAVLAPMADAYRKLWLGERASHQKTKSVLKERFGSEPTLTSGGGSGDNAPEVKSQQDLNRPFSEVFLEEFHRQQNRNR